MAKAETGIFSKSIKFFPPSEIIIPPERQRSNAKETEDLEPSIRARGIYNPIIIKRNMELVAGERRLQTALKLGMGSVPTRFVDELDPIELQLVELEENERRKDLPWKDHAKALAKIHSLYQQKAAAAGDPWSLEKTGEMLFYGQGWLSKALRVARDIDSPKITNAPGLSAAYNILSRMDERRIGDAISSITAVPQAKAAQAAAEAKALLDEINAPPPVADPKTGIIPAASPAIIRPAKPALPPPPPPESILLTSFLEWAPAYEGEKFSFVHCDFPYGVNLFAGPQSGRDKWENYDDNPDIYWELIRCFCANRDRFLAASAHIMFWFDMDYYDDTLALFNELAPEIAIRRKPLIWTKTCNTGVLSDPKRGPRHIYETCLVMSREDRYIVKAKSDSYGCHADKGKDSIHPSTKPVAMLANFMEMFVDEHTRMLDPTCGSGASLRAAESLGAVSVLGLEINPEFCEPARQALKQARVKAALSKRV